MKKILPLIIAGITVLTSCSFFSSSYDEKLVKTLEDGNSNAFIDGGVGRDNGDEDERIIVNPPKDVEPQEEPHEEPHVEPKEEPKVEPKIEDDIVYTITFEDGRGKVLQQDYVPAGLTPFYEGELPTKSSSQYYKHYAFNGWVPEIAPASKDQVYKANFSEVYYNYTVRFFDDDGVTILSSEEYIYGDVVKKPSNPTKARTVSSSYVFSGWRTKNSKTVLSTIPTVTNDADYYAVYTSTTNKYRITFKNEDGTILQEEDYEYGKTPTYKMSTPTKAKTAGQEFVFTGWQPNISTVIGDETYVATFNSNNRQYAVRFLNDDGSLLKTVYVNYGYTPSYGGTPTKAADAQYTYSFNKWNPALQPVSESSPTDYVASFNSTIRKYSVKFRNATNTADLQSFNLEYGKTPSYTGSTPTKSTVESSSGITSYKFLGWNTNDKATSALSTLPTVTQNVVFYPIFSSSTVANRKFTLIYSSYIAHPYEKDVDILPSGYNQYRELIKWSITTQQKNIVFVSSGRISTNGISGTATIQAKLDGCVQTLNVEVVDITLKTKKNYTYEPTGRDKWHPWANHVYMETSKTLTNPITLTYDLLNDKNWFYIYFTNGANPESHVDFNSFKPYEDGKAFIKVKSNDSYWSTRPFGEAYYVKFKISFTKKNGNEVEVGLAICRQYSHYTCS